MILRKLTFGKQTYQSKTLSMNGIVCFRKYIVLERLNFRLQYFKNFKKFQNFHKICKKLKNYKIFKISKFLYHESDIFLKIGFAEILEIPYINKGLLVILTPLPMVYRLPYPWYIDPLTHGILTPYPWYIDPHTHGILTPLSMVF